MLKEVAWLFVLGMAVIMIVTGSMVLWVAALGLIW